MSSPKSYTPPPQYSMQVFDGKLNQIFKLQSDLQILLQTLNGSGCHDAERNIHFDYQNFLKQHAEDLKAQVAAFVMNHPGTFGQEVYDDFEKQINQKIKALEKWLKIVMQEQTVLEALMKDYEAFLTSEKFQSHSAQSFERHKAQVIDYLEKYLKKDLPTIFNEAKQRIEAIRFAPSKPTFKTGFLEALATAKHQLEQEMEECEQQVARVRTEIANQVISQLPPPPRSTEPTDIITAPAEMKQKIKVQLDKIKAFIGTVDSMPRQQEYEKRLDLLMQSACFRNDDYFYMELLDDIMQTEKTIQFKIEIQQLMTRLNQMMLQSELQSNRLDLMQTGVRLLEQTKVRIQEFENFEAQIVFLKQKQTELEQEKLIREKERLFLKQQIVKSLESLHYVVVDDLQVIDFEERILKVPDQENYIKLLFLPDGTFIYNFLMPEARVDLSLEQKQQKLREMETTCREFKQLLHDLARMGLQLKVNIEKPASEDGFITIAEKDRSRMKKEAKKAVSAPKVQRKSL